MRPHHPRTPPPSSLYVHPRKTCRFLEGFFMRFLVPSFVFPVHFPRVFTCIHLYRLSILSRVPSCVSMRPRVPSFLVKPVTPTLEIVRILPSASKSLSERSALKTLFFWQVLCVFQILASFPCS